MLWHLFSIGQSIRQVNHSYIDQNIFKISSSNIPIQLFLNIKIPSPERFEQQKIETAQHFP